MIKNYLATLANSVKEYYVGSAAFDRAIERNNRLLRKFYDRSYTHAQIGGLPEDIQKLIDEIRQTDKEKTDMLHKIFNVQEGTSATIKLIGDLTENVAITNTLLKYLMELRKFVNDDQLNEMVHQLKEIDRMLHSILI